MQTPKRLNLLYTSSNAPTLVAMANVTRTANPREVQWATYKLNASCKHRPIMMFLELHTTKEKEQ
jgi:hypothetical protein